MERKRFTSVEPWKKVIVRSKEALLSNETHQLDTCRFWDYPAALCGAQTSYNPLATTPAYTLVQLNSSVTNRDDESRLRVELTWETNLVRYQSPEFLPPPNAQWVVEFQGVHVVDLAVSVNDPPRV